MSSIANSQTFLRSKNDGIGDYYHGQSIGYYHRKTGILMKHEQRLVCLWSNSGAEFDPEAYKSFQPHYTFWVDDDMNLVTPESPNISPPAQHHFKESSKKVEKIPEVPKKSTDVIDVLQKSISKPVQPPSKKQKTVDEPKKIVDEPEKKKNLTENDKITDAIVDIVVEQTTIEKTIDEEQSEIQEFYAKEVTKSENPVEPEPKKQKVASTPKKAPKSKNPKKGPPKPKKPQARRNPPRKARKNSKKK